jgi:hypothetical protein
MDKNKDKPVLEAYSTENRRNQQTSAKFSLSPLYKFLWETFVTAIIVITVILVLNYDIVDEILRGL